MTISVKALRVNYRVPVRPPGLRAALSSVVDRQYRDIVAVDDVSFDISAGEIVGFIGPNGAGKTTTMKVLSGILHPTSGDIDVLGFRPERRETAFLKAISLIRGSQPYNGAAELTVGDALRLQRLIYDVDEGTFRRNLTVLTELLGLDRLIDRQIRALSLGERMRCGFALALVYGPRLLFLDEPTIGMDVSVSEATRTFLAEYVATTGATVLLTSHQMADVERLCDRILLIDHGRLTFDGRLETLAHRVTPTRILTVTLPSAETYEWAAFGTVLDVTPTSVHLEIAADAVPGITRALLEGHETIADLSISQPPIEKIIDRVYREGIT